MLLPVDVESDRKRFPLATFLLVVINLVIYAGCVLEASGEGDPVLDSVRALPAEVLNRWALWPAHPTALSIFTAPWIHLGIVHLLGNLLFLWVFGVAAEATLGPAALLGIYLAGGLSSILVQLEMAMAGVAPVEIKYAGSSGAIIAVIVAFAIRRYRDRVRLWLVVVEVAAPAWVALVALLGWYALIPGLTGASGGPDGYWGHLGGAATGLIGALFLKLGSRGLVEYSVEDAARIIERGDLKGGLARLEELRRRTPADPRVLLALARAHVRTWDAAEASRYYCQAIQAEMAARHSGAALGAWEEAIRSRVAVPTTLTMSLAGFLAAGDGAAHAAVLYQWVVDDPGASVDANVLARRRLDNLAR